MLETLGIMLFIVGVWGLAPPLLVIGLVQLVVTIFVVRWLVQVLVPRPH